MGALKLELEIDDKHFMKQIRRIEKRVRRLERFSRRQDRGKYEHVINVIYQVKEPKTREKNRWRQPGTNPPPSHPKPFFCPPPQKSCADSIHAKPDK